MKKNLKPSIIALLLFICTSSAIANSMLFFVAAGEFLVNGLQHGDPGSWGVTLCFFVGGMLLVISIVAGIFLLKMLGLQIDKHNTFLSKS